MRMALQLRTKHRTLTNPSLVHLFSTSSSDPLDSSDPTEPNPQSHSPSVSDYFSDVKASLKQQSPQQQQQQSRPIAQNPSFFNTAQSRPSQAASLQEIRKNLSEFRRRSVGPNPTESNSAPWQRSSTTAPNPSQHQQISFQDLFNKGVKSGKIEFEAIRESLKLIRPNANEQNERKGDGLSLSKFTKSLEMKPNDVVGRPQALPRLFDKELKERNAENALKTEFVRIFSYKELGEKLKKLRPEAKGGGWFTLGELSERLIKLREMEENEAKSRLQGKIYVDLRESLITLSEQEALKKTSVQKLSLLADLGQTPDYMLKPPKEVLVEKYFHPDNMSSAEKLKVELGKVRDEFKMSESDCGSARVQVAQLTTKIKHLSSVLHKKDKHSLKGLQAMVQRRKKLLKYLRRTDWDSYCLVLSKLGLRDTPDYKQEYKKHYKN